ncbi:probable ERJ5 Endoplasmic Reticulum located J-protein [Phialocephala subalpina]|uniref:Probable ERJ5 Endoplasmic Reticulum located J-protein n=1 Tax=Phialocephala subalpina TaxID=576137 RepID=A0A1L7WEQ5_9HELO|nr:probable ERJ5 Endoplasmic Reticulum located J-protein [Phialocephala subalpina]
MRLSSLTVGLLASLVITVAAWSKEDQEIFRLRDEVELHEGPGVTFYDFLGTTPSANQDEINKAYKKRSRTLHPDKVKQQFIADKSTGKDKKKSKKPGVHVSKGPTQAEIKATAKAASDRFARLGIVTNILRGEGRARYDHFLSNGFPKWKGTGYYYARFRPGLGSVLVGLFIFVGGGGHYIALYMSWKRQQEFVGRYIKFARHAAWGENLNIPGLDGVSGTSTPVSTADDADPMAQPMNRRQRRMQEKDSKKEKGDKKSKLSKSAKASPAATPPVGATGPRKRVVAENGKVLIVDAVGNVYLEQQDEEGETHEFLLDVNEIQQPTIKDTALYRVPIWAYNSVVGRFSKKSESDDEDEEFEEEQNPPSSSSDDFEVLEKVKTSSQNENGKAIRRKKSNRGR